MRLESYVDVSDINTKVLKRDCSQILNIYKKLDDMFLYRGMKEKFEFKKFIPLKGRKPRDTKPDLHELWDRLFYEKFGWRPRSEGVFTSPMESYTETFGKNIYIILPKNGFKYICEPMHDNIYKQKFFTDDRDMLLSDTWEELIDQYTDDNIEKIFIKKPYSEIVVKCSYYYAVRNTLKNIKIIESIL